MVFVLLVHDLCDPSSCSPSVPLLKMESLQDFRASLKMLKGTNLKMILALTETARNLAPHAQDVVDAITEWIDVVSKLCSRYYYSFALLLYNYGRTCFIIHLLF